MNLNSKKSLGEFISWNNQEKVSPESVNRFLAYHQQAANRFLNETGRVESEDEGQFPTSSLRDKTGVNSFTNRASEKISSENPGVSGITPTAVASGDAMPFTHLAYLSIFNEIPVGEYFLNFRSAYLSNESKNFMNYVIQKMRSKIETYGENSATITGKSWLEHFIDEGRNVILSGGSPAEDYLYILFVMKTTLGETGGSAKMTTRLLDTIQSYFDNTNGFNTDYDTFRVVMMVMLGITARMEDYLTVTGGPEGYFQILKNYFDNGTMENCSSAVAKVTELFLTLTNFLVRSKTHLFLTDPTITGMEIPCGIYVEQEVEGAERTAIVHVCFEAFGKKFYMTFYSFGGMVGYYPSEGTSMYLTVSR